MVKILDRYTVDTEKNASISKTPNNDAVLSNIDDVLSNNDAVLSNNGVVLSKVGSIPSLSRTLEQKSQYLRINLSAYSVRSSQKRAVYPKSLMFSATIRTFAASYKKSNIEI